MSLQWPQSVSSNLSDSFYTFSDPFLALIKPPWCSANKDIAPLKATKPMDQTACLMCFTCKSDSNIQ